VLHALRDGVDTFDEISCAYGALGRFQLREAMTIVKGMRQKLNEIVDHFYTL
jgi:2,3-bisphosphoglycerate-independent phosphoglycerate mutase